MSCGIPGWGDGADAGWHRKGGLNQLSAARPTMGCIRGNARASAQGPARPATGASRSGAIPLTQPAKHTVFRLPSQRPSILGLASPHPGVGWPGSACSESSAVAGIGPASSCLLQSGVSSMTRPAYRERGGAIPLSTWRPGDFRHRSSRYESTRQPSWHRPPEVLRAHFRRGNGACPHALAQLLDHQGG